MLIKVAKNMIASLQNYFALIYYFALYFFGGEYPQESRKTEEDL